MATKKNKREEIKEENKMELGNVKTIEGYVIYNKNDKIYYDEDDCYKNIDDVTIYDDLDEVKGIVEELDGEEIYGIEIHKIKVEYHIEEIQERNVVWNVIAGKVESN